MKKMFSEIIEIVPNELNKELQDWQSNGIDISEHPLQPFFDGFVLAVKYSDIVLDETPIDVPEIFLGYFLSQLDFTDVFF